MDDYRYVPTMNLRWAVPPNTTTEAPVLQQLWEPTLFPRDKSLPEPQDEWRAVPLIVVLERRG